MFPPSTTNCHRGEIPDTAIFGQTGKRKAELKGQPLDAPCPAAQALHRSPCPRTHTKTWLPGWPGGNTGRTGRRRSAAGAGTRRPSLVLDESLHLVHEVPGQLQDLLGVVSLGHF